MLHSGSELDLLADFPERFAGDPQEGIRAILSLLPDGSTIQGHRLPTGNAWNYAIQVPADGKIDERTQVYTVLYVEPVLVGSAGTFDRTKAEAVRCFLRGLVAVAGLYHPGYLEAAQGRAERTRKQTLSATLASARVTPEVAPEVVSTTASLASLLSPIYGYGPGVRVASPATAPTTLPPVTWRTAGPDVCLECSRPDNKHYTTCPRWKAKSTPVDDFVARVIARKQRDS